MSFFAYFIVILHNTVIMPVQTAQRFLDEDNCIFHHTCLAPRNSFFTESMQQKKSHMFMDEKIKGRLPSDRKSLIVHQFNLLLRNLLLNLRFLFLGLGTFLTYLDFCLGPKNPQKNKAKPDSIRQALFNHGLF